jgi:hypothetical protein
MGGPRHFLLEFGARSNYGQRIRGKARWRLLYRGDTSVLNSIVYEFLSGSSAEAIQQAYSTVTLEEVYGAIAFYLANRAEVEEYLALAEQEYEKMRLEAREKNPLLYRKLEEARRAAQLQKK